MNLKPTSQFEEMEVKTSWPKQNQSFDSYPDAGEKPHPFCNAPLGPKSNELETTSSEFITWLE